MEIPKYSFITMVPWAGPILAERWKIDLNNASGRVLEEYEYMLKRHTSPKGDFSIYSRMAQCKTKAELAIELTTVAVTFFDSFQYEIRDTYREYFRDTVYPDEFFEDADAVSVKEILTEFYKVHPDVTVVTMMPLDFEGTFGFVVIPKDMNP